MANYAELICKAGDKMIVLKGTKRIKKAKKKLAEKTSRDIIKNIFLKYKVPKVLQESYWRAYNAAHMDLKRQIYRG